MAVAITRAQLRTIDLSDFKKMPERQQQQVLSRARKEFRRVAKGLSQSGLYSHALGKHLDVYGILDTEYPRQPRDIIIEYDGLTYNLSRAADPRVMSINAMLQELASYQTFFQSKSSTIKGIKEINRQQDKAIFGASSKGTPLYTMTEKERRYMWSVFDEFNNQEFAKVDRGIYGSDDVRRVVAEIIRETHATSQNDLDFMSIIKEAKNRIDAYSINQPYIKWSNESIFEYDGI